MNVKYINPFIESTENVLKAIASIEIDIGKVYNKTPNPAENYFNVSMNFSGQLRGLAVLSMQKSVAASIASNMIDNAGIVELEDVTKSAITELTNIILGNAVTLLSSKGISSDVSTSLFLSGNDLISYSKKHNMICIPFLLENKTAIELYLYLEKE